MAIKIAINGFGRIGRTFFRQAYKHKDIDIVAINDLGDIGNLAYLLRYDSVYGHFDKNIEAKESNGERWLIVDGEKMQVFAEKEPEKLPWGKLGVDVVIESTGFFASDEGGKKHLTAGAKRVVISAPAKGDVEHVLLGTNDDRLSMQTVHAYTATQGLVDGPGSKGDYRRGRAAAQNIVPSHTGAAEAVVKSLPAFENLVDGIALRVPVVEGSLAMVTFVAKRTTTVEEVNDIFRKAAEQPRWKGIVGVTEEQLVSSDVRGTTEAAIIDLTFTRVVDGDLVTVFSWYDNEWAYSHTLIEHVIKVGKLL
ncbi:MAG: Glyceraldehyde-3-phosphate dehydrogenase, type I [Parcubacteria group bacterium GW2011_GWA2_40_8]|nr:MAG: Glyceraldehyde-3-phosphate dehydrogenase, type I [Parcubacteria group bacterium GW2011_GWA2_40_8]